MDSEINTERPTSGCFAKLFAGLAFFIIATAGQQAFAQQGDECLACHTGLPATVSNLIPEDTGSDNSGTDVAVSASCDYSAADMFGGWGWNPFTRESCPPVENSDSENTDQVASNCDYSSADQFGGWGWDAVARQSCPPLESEDPHANFPICSATLFDADGDGFGWENQASCIITSASEPAPVFTNLETGNQVDLIRAYWDGNTDLANKIVQCDLYYYDSYWREYRREPVPFRSGADLNNQVFPSYRFQHLSLPPAEPYLGWIADVSYVENGTVTATPFAVTPHWTTDDGRYVGPTVLQSPYIERVTLDDGSRALRTWHRARQDTGLNLQFSGNRVRNEGYFECRDISGRDLEPTGIVGGGTSSPVQLSDLVFSTEPGSLQQDLQSITNRETGESVQLQKAYWDYNNDLAGKTVTCEAFGHDAYDSYFTLGIFEQYEFPYHFTNSGNRIHYRESEINMQNSSFLVENGVLKDPNGGAFGFSTLFASDHVELLGNSQVRFWTSSNDFSECTGVVPTGSAPVIVDRNQCDYSGADNFNGWGWNPVTRQSCPPQDATTDVPVTASACDYSNASSFNGWGWNPVTSESCAPLSNDQTQNDTDGQACDYSNAGSNGGWGWNAVTGTSCAPR